MIDGCFDISSKKIGKEELFCTVVPNVSLVKIRGNFFKFKRSVGLVFGFSLFEKMSFEDFAFLCKEYCFSKGFNLSSSVGKCSFSCSSGGYFFSGETEVECIFSATERVLSLIKATPNRA